jgi:hypothetical protein
MRYLLDRNPFVPLPSSVLTNEPVSEDDRGIVGRHALYSFPSDRGSAADTVCAYG